MRRATTAVFTSLLLTLLPLNSSIAANKSEAEQELSLNLGDGRVRRQRLELSA
jgi:hypothetical protein